MDCPGGPGPRSRLPRRCCFNPCFNGLSRRTEPVDLLVLLKVCFNPCFNGLSRRTGPGARVHRQVQASTLVLMDCPGGRARHAPDEVIHDASTLVLMDCPGGRRGRLVVLDWKTLQPLF